MNIRKGSRVQVNYDKETVYVVHSVKKGQVYAVSEDGRSGRWFDQEDLSWA